MYRMIVQPVALFVFVPFCKIKCTYCDFNAYANMTRVMEPYADSVAREIENKGQREPDRPRLQSQSIYFGGGTPSLVPTAHIEKIMQACRRAFAVAPDAEITLEANPGTVDAEKLAALLALGINRLSLGVQSFQDAVLRRLNRGHTVSDALTTYDLARRAGFDNINFDFIYGLPLQSLDDWRTTLERAVALAPEHLSLYALKVEEDTGLKHQIRRGQYPAPDDDLAADMYEYACEALASAGYEQYEISNWSMVGARDSSPRLDAGDSPMPTRATDKRDIARVRARPSAYPSRHNLTYWHNEPYFGFGAGAHSSFAGARSWNVLSPVEYIQRVERGETVEHGREEIRRELEMAETMILGLRLNAGIEFAAFASRYGEDARSSYGARLAELIGLGLLESLDKTNPEGHSGPFGSGVRLTARGRLLSNEVFWRFLPD
jgi:oxygen-independent coproporphyrinogen-3 oxidase